MRFFLFILAMLFWVAPTFGAIDSGSVFGVWLTEEGNSKLEIYPCGDKTCAKVVWLKYPTYLNSKEGPVGMDRVDGHNPDPTMQSRPILGLQVMEGLTLEGEWWQHGSCYDPQSGKHYQCRMHLESPTELKLRGFIGFSAIGRTYSLTRDPSVWTANSRDPKGNYH
jgi:uncharacterized protein (DUF2147 family)